jgi:hypothetical protein
MAKKKVTNQTTTEDDTDWLDDAAPAAPAPADVAPVVAEPAQVPAPVQAPAAPAAPPSTKVQVLSLREGRIVLKSGTLEYRKVLTMERVEAEALIAMYGVTQIQII